MSIEFNLPIATHLAPREALAILLQELNLDWASDKHLLAPGVLIGAIEKSPLARLLIEEEFGFRPTIDLHFRINPKDEYLMGKRTVLRATMALLCYIQSDAVLLHNGENIVLQRIGGKLRINQDWGTWTQLDLAEVTLPYETANLVSPLLK